MHLRHSAAIPTPTGWKLRVDMDSKAWILIRPPCMSINARFDSSTTIYSLSGSRALAYKTQVFAAFFQHELKTRYCKKTIAMLSSILSPATSKPDHPDQPQRWHFEYFYMTFVAYSQNCKPERGCRWSACCRSSGPDSPKTRLGSFALMHYLKVWGYFSMLRCQLSLNSCTEH